jgi:PAS domain S-box-containing protein
MKLAVPGLFTLLGLVIGVLFVRGLTDNGTPFVLSAVVLSCIVVTGVAVRFYIMKQKRIIGSPETSKDGSQVGFVVDTFQDVVGRLKVKERELEQLKASAEEKAIRMEAYSENILQSVPSGVISIDNSGQIKSINQAAERILGISAHEAIERRFSDVCREPLISLVKAEKTVSRDEYAYVTNDKRNIWLGITSSRLMNSSGEKIGMIFVFTDLTDIKQLQAQVDLKQRLSQLGEMSAGIAHELRNSMSVISGYAKLLGKKVDDAGKTTAASIQAEIGTMDNIISELLAFAKPTDLNVGPVHVNELIRQAVSSVTGSRAEVNVLIHDDSPISIKADELLLKQAVSNLLTNAVEAMPQGGTIDILLRQITDRVEIRVRDTGQGIPRNVLQKIFLPFYTTKEEGIGFGLALVQKIIISHGGSIEVESEEGKGATFLITLPVK